MTDFSNKTTRKANKPHNCEFCKKQIEKGETYERVFVAGDSVCSYALHTFCDSISQQELRESPDFDCALDFLFECAQQKVFDEKDNASIAEFYDVTAEQITFVFGEVAA